MLSLRLSYLSTLYININLYTLWVQVVDQGVVICVWLPPLITQGFPITGTYVIHLLQMLEEELKVSLFAHEHVV